MTKTLPPQPDDDFDIREPQDLDAETYAQLEALLRHQIEQGLADPLLGISEESELQLVALAYHDVVRFERLERVIKDAIRARNDGEAAVKAFNLATFKRAAQQTRRRIQDENSRRAKMRQRNLHLIQGGKDRREGTDVEVDDASISVQAMVQSPSVFLRAAGQLKMFRPGRLWFDDFHGNYFTNWSGEDDDRVIAPQIIDDAFLLKVHGYLLMLDTKLGSSSTGNTEKVIRFVADKDHRNEPKEWLKGLKWDGQERLPSLLAKAYGAPDDDYHRAVGRCWFVSMAARMCTPGEKVDTMPVFIGPQGTSKSSSLKVIGGKWYATLNMSAENKDFVGALPGLIVGEIAELDAISGHRVENSRVKTLLSTSEDLFRPPYGRTHRKFLRTVVFVGTTNEAGWHRDESGGRRFWPVRCVGDIDIAYLRENREQLFAEACARYSRCEKWWDVPQKEHALNIEQSRQINAWEDLLSPFLDNPDLYTDDQTVKPKLGKGIVGASDVERWGNVVTTARVGIQWLGIPPERLHANTMRIAATMRQLGWVQVSRKLEGKNKRFWIPAQIGMMHANSQKTEQGPPELPF